MIRITAETDDFGRLVCTVAQGGSAAVVTSAEASTAAADLLAAVEEAAAGGFGECFWREAGGEYRWMLRREGEQLRFTVLWTAGTLTGWEHKLSAECGFDAFAAEVRAALRPVVG